MAPTFYNPVPGFGPAKIADTFGPNVRPGGHTGWDFRAPRRTPIHPSAPGTVYAIVRSGACGYGVRIRHSDGWTSSYCHFDEAPLVEMGDIVDYTTILGYVGRTGNASYYHLHASWELNGVRQAPDGILEGTIGDWIRPGYEEEVTMFTQQGDTGTYVEFWQSVLIQLGENLTYTLQDGSRHPTGIDGIYGTKTTAAVSRQLGGDGEQIGPNEAARLLSRLRGGLMEFETVNVLRRVLP